MNRTHQEDEFDRDASEQSEARVVNVSPMPARFEIATVAGTKPRRYKLEPGGSVYLQHGYTVPFLGVSQKTVKPTIETVTEREAWPGVRGKDAEGKVVWTVQPGPVLPQVCSEERAAEFRARWDAAMKARDEVTTAPLRMRLSRSDGSTVDVEAAIDTEPPVPMRRKAATASDDEDQAGPIEEPPPDHNEPEPVTLPPAVPMRKGRG